MMKSEWLTWINWVGGGLSSAKTGTGPTSVELALGADLCLAFIHIICPAIRSQVAEKCLADIAESLPVALANFSSMARMSFQSSMKKMMEKKSNNDMQRKLKSDLQEQIKEKQTLLDQLHNFQDNQQQIVQQTVQRQLDDLNQQHRKLLIDLQHNTEQQIEKEKQEKEEIIKQLFDIQQRELELTGEVRNKMEETKEMQAERASLLEKLDMEKKNTTMLLAEREIKQKELQDQLVQDKEDLNNQLKECQTSLQTLQAKCEQLERDKTEKEDQKLCIICLERPRDILFLPCGHFSVCSECADLTTCPICRITVEKKQKVFF